MRVFQQKTRILAIYNNIQLKTELKLIIINYYCVITVKKTIIIEF